MVTLHFLLVCAEILQITMHYELQETIKTFLNPNSRAEVYTSPVQLKKEERRTNLAYILLNQRDAIRKKSKLI